MKTFDQFRADETARRIRNREKPVPMIERETVKAPGDLIISAHRVELVPDRVVVP